MSAVCNPNPALVIRSIACGTIQQALDWLACKRPANGADRISLRGRRSGRNRKWMCQQQTVRLVSANVAGLPRRIAG